MYHVSRPLIALLVGTVAFFALWLVALKPSSPNTSGGSSGLGAYQSAIDKAHQAVSNSNAAGVAHGGTDASTTAVAKAATARASAAGTPVRPAPTPARVPRAAANRRGVVEQALREKKVIALLFYNPAAADDQALKGELAAVPTHGARVVKLAVPLSELARYAVLTNQVAVEVSPTLVLVDPARQATTIVGFADRFEIAQRVTDALGAG
jgi:hypothetical protein